MRSSSRRIGSITAFRMRSDAKPECKGNSRTLNLFGGPGIGKSSIASGITYKLKKNHITCDNPYEFPKLLAWDENKEAIKDQFFIAGNQHRGIAKSYGKVDYIVVDSPILFSLVYTGYYDKGYPSDRYGESFFKFIKEKSSRVLIFLYQEFLNLFLQMVNLLLTKHGMVLWNL